MSVPVVQIAEFNGSGATETDNIPLIAFAAVDQASTSMLSAANPVLVATNSYEKWLRAKVVTPALNTLSAFTVQFQPTNPADSEGATNTLAFKFGVNHAYVQPTAATSTVATTNCTGAPPTAVTAPANSVGAFSGYVTLQAQIGAGAAGGDAQFNAAFMTLNFVYS